MSILRCVTRPLIRTLTAGVTDSQRSKGPDLITNGTFDTDLTGWTDAGGDGSAAVVAGVMQLTKGTTTEERRQVLTVEIGGTYELRATLGGVSPIIFLGSAAAAADYGNLAATGTKTLVATTTVLSVRC